MQQHYCTEHKSKYYKNEKVAADGQIKVWYSHKKSDGSGFCLEDRKVDQPMLITDESPTQGSGYHKMFACNAMNNAVALAASGKITVDQIGSYYKRIFIELASSSQ
jgi:hypothetical protein